METPSRGRFAPSPTGRLHLGNLRTALVAWEEARSKQGTFVVRMEDLDRANSSIEWASGQLQELALLGIVSDDEVIFQSDRFEIYAEFLNRLTSAGLTYECFCSRKDIAAASSAPHGSTGSYPGTCRNLNREQRAARSLTRSPALRLRVDEISYQFENTADIVLRRNDGVPAYNLAVVVDDELQGVTKVVRGLDLEDVTPSQRQLQQYLGFRELEYLHVPLMVGPDGLRLAKRHGDVTLSDCIGAGLSPLDVRTALLRSIEAGTNGWGLSSNVVEWLKSLL